MHKKVSNLSFEFKQNGWVEELDSAGYQLKNFDTVH